MRLHIAHVRVRTNLRNSPLENNLTKNPDSDDNITPQLLNLNLFLQIFTESAAGSVIEFDYPGFSFFLV